MLIAVGGDIVHQISALNGGGGVNASDEFGQLHLLIEGADRLRQHWLLCPGWCRFWRMALPVA